MLDDSKVMLNPAELTGNFDSASVNNILGIGQLKNSEPGDSGRNSRNSRNNASQYSFVDAAAFKLRLQEETA